MPTMTDKAKLLQDEPLFANASANRSLTGRDLLIILFKRKLVILTLWISVSMLVAAALMYLPATYVADAKVLFKIEQQGHPAFLSGISVYNIAPDAEPANRKLETEMEVLLSRPLAEQVVKELKLQPKDMYRPPYVHLFAPLGQFIDRFKNEVLGLPLSPAHDFDTTSEAFIKSLTIAPAKSKGGEATPNLILISFKAASATVVNEALTRLITHYQHFSNKLDQENGLRAHHIVEQRLNAAATVVAQAQEQLKNFAAKVQPVGIEADLPLLGGAAGKNTTPPGQSATNGAVSILRARVAQLEIELSEQQQRFTDRVDSVTAVKEALAGAQKTLAAKTAQSASNADQLMTLQRNMRLAEDLYLDLRHKLTQIELFLEMNPNLISNRVLVDPPLIPESSEWKKSLVIGIAASIAGLLLGLGIASILEYTDHRLINPDDVQHYTGIPLLVSIDKMDKNHLRLFIGISKTDTP